MYYFATGLPRGSVRTDGRPSPLRTQSDKDRARIAARRKELSTRDQALLAYLDCGLQVHSEGDTVNIRQLQGKGWTFKGSEALSEIPPCHKDITFDKNAIVFRITGLPAKRAVSLFLTWWDFNSSGRKQSIWAAPKQGDASTRLHKTTLLPGWKGKKQRPETISLKLPSAVIENGCTIITIRKDAGVNAVLGEMWITE